SRDAWLLSAKKKRPTVRPGASGSATYFPRLLSSRTSTKFPLARCRCGFAVDQFQHLEELSSVSKEFHPLLFNRLESVALLKGLDNAISDGSEVANQVADAGYHQKQRQEGD